MLPKIAPDSWLAKALSSRAPENGLLFVIGLTVLYLAWQRLQDRVIVRNDSHSSVLRLRVAFGDGNALLFENLAPGKVQWQPANRNWGRGDSSRAIQITALTWQGDIGDSINETAVLPQFYSFGWGERLVVSVVGSHEVNVTSDGI